MTLVFPAILLGQAGQSDDRVLNAILERLDRLEQQNAKLQQQNEELRAEIGKLREDMAERTSLPAMAPPSDAASPGTGGIPASAPVDERVAVVETRVAEQAQSKVESAHKLPVSLTGMLLFNGYANAGAAPGFNSLLLQGPAGDGATIGQSLLGFQFQGPALPGNGRLSGFLDMDFLENEQTYGYGARLRRGVITMDWPNRTLVVGQDKALISQRQPDSLAQVAYGALADSGNPWYWQPQVRYTEKFHAGDNSGFDVQVSAIETAEFSAYNPEPGYDVVEGERPGFEARFNYWHRSGGETRFEFAPGVHVSNSRVNDLSVPSRFGTVDWLIKPVRWFQFSGLLWGGENLAVLGGFADGYTFSPAYRPEAVRGLSGWGQLSFALTPRLTLNTFGGFQAPHTADLFNGAVTHESALAGNLIYRLRSNVLLGLEVLQERTGYFGQPHTLQNHYDVAIGYLF